MKHGKVSQLPTDQGKFLLIRADELCMVIQMNGPNFLFAPTDASTLAHKLNSWRNSLNKKRREQAMELAKEKFVDSLDFRMQHRIYDVDCEVDEDSTDQFFVKITFELPLVVSRRR